MQKEIQALQEKSVDKMKIFHENAETRLKSLWSRSQFDYEQMSKRLFDHLKTYSDNVSDAMSRYDVEKKEETEKISPVSEKKEDKTKNFKESKENLEKSGKLNGSAGKNNKIPVGFKR